VNRKKKSHGGAETIGGGEGGEGLGMGRGRGVKGSSLWGRPNLSDKSTDVRKRRTFQKLKEGGHCRGENGSSCFESGGGEVSSGAGREGSPTLASFCSEREGLYFRGILPIHNERGVVACQPGGRNSKRPID